jgi:hypothetical protein
MAQIKDIKCESKIALSDASINFYGAEAQGFEHAGIEGFTSQEVRKRVVAGTAVRNDLCILKCRCTMDDGEEKTICFLSLAPKASFTL